MCPPPVATASDNRLRNCLISYSEIDTVLTNLLPAGLHDFFQVLNVSNATTTLNKLLECSRDRIVYWVQVWAIRRPLFWFCKCWYMKTHLLMDTFSYYLYLVSTTSATTSHRVLITEEYLNAYFFSVFLSVCALQVLKALLLCKFSETGLKVRIVWFILLHPVCVSTRQFKRWQRSKHRGLQANV